MLISNSLLTTKRNENIYEKVSTIGYNVRVNQSFERNLFMRWSHATEFRRDYGVRNKTAKRIFQVPTLHV